MNDRLISLNVAIDAAIEAVDNWEGNTSIGRQKRIEKILKALPPVQSEPKSYRMGFQAGYAAAQRWIPVTEKLPDKEGLYLCTVQGYVGKATYLRIADFHQDIYIEYDIEEHKPGFIDYDSEYGFYEVTKVLAWMSLPTPWEGGQEQNHESTI